MATKTGEMTIRYRARDLGYGVERGIAQALVTDEVDTWGKRTIYVLGEWTWEKWYLFPDEWRPARRKAA